MDKMQKTISEILIEGSLIVIGLAEAAHLTALFLKLPFHVCAWMMAVLFFAALVAAAIPCLFRQIRKKTHRSKADGESGVRRFFKLLRLYPVLFVIIGALLLFQFIWNYGMQTPYIAGDITVETVQTMLASDGIYTVNPMTGQAFTAGMPLRLEILVLPTLYAALCSFTGISARIMCYGIIPALVLFISYLVYGRWAAYLFPKEGKKQALFLLFTALVYQFGCYSGAMDGFTLFFCGYRGAAIRVGIILPYTLLCSLQKKWKSVILCLLAEICVVWTFYGLGYAAAAAGIVCMIRLIQKSMPRLYQKKKA